MLINQPLQEALKSEQKKYLKNIKNFKFTINFLTLKHLTSERDNLTSYFEH